ncbi:toll-like receptor 7 isoform X2 [Sceloporus undulatus]|nr:toll-like receptor 7 isoform X2 [Sceloporus undulatus]
MIRLAFFMISLLSKGIPALWYPKTLPCTVTNATPSYVIVDCSEQHLTEFPEGIPNEVTNLSLTINHIKNIVPSNFEKLKHLMEIDFRCNCLPPMLGPKDLVCTRKLQIETQSFANLFSLTSLYLDGNQLSAIPRGLPHNLRLLSLEVNIIFSIHKEDLIELGNLESLFLGKNCYYRNPCNTSFFINETAFQALTSLKVLSLKANNISSVPKNLPSTLTELHLYNNVIRNISEYDLSGLHNLEKLDLSGNCPRCHNAPYHCTECPNKMSIAIHPKAFDSLGQLKVLRLHSTSLRTVNSRWFNQTKKLEVLDLSQNYLADEIEKSHFLNYLPNLVDLDLSFNFKLGSYRPHLKLSKIFSKLHNLQTLRLRGFVFKELDQNTIQNLVSLKNLSVLDFGTNFIRNVDLTMFKKFPALKVVSLSFNKISLFANNSNGRFCSVPEPSADQYDGSLLQDMQYFMYDEYGRSCKSKDKEVTYTFPFVTEASCRNYGETLDLSRNNIFYITRSDFQQLTYLKCLNLSSNAMSQALNGSEFKYLSGLKYLDFSNNRIDLVYPNAFQWLKELEILNLSDNSHYFKAEGITHLFSFTKHLVKLTTLIMNGNEISTSTDKGMASHSLKILEFRRNRLDILWRDGTPDHYSFFKNLTKLEKLDISENSLDSIPPDVFDGLPPKLKELRLANNNMKTFKWDKLLVLEKLEVLDLSNNLLTTVPRELSNCSKTLQKFLLQNNRIKKLTDNFLQDAFPLKYLDLSFNKIKTLRKSSFPKNVINNLDTLVLNGNPFKCNCDLVWFAWWINQTSVTIPLLATDVTCAGPGAWKGKSVVYLDLETCEIDLSQILYLASVTAIMFLMIITMIGHLYFWDMWYFYHFFIASLKGYKRLFSSDVVYDAFVAYDKKDVAVSEWVLKELVEKLEDKREKQFNLCLEERDWLPGEPVLTNLSESIQMSRKTIFVLTNRYIASGNFRIAFYMAHQRLMDEKVDVIILIFLEKVLQMSKCLRLRKILCSRSVLEWPTNPQSQCYFWHCLRNSLTANHDMSYSKLFKEMV